MSILVSIASLKSEGAAPRYEQIANAVSQAIRSGQLKPGDRLPTVRALASDLGVSLTTVTAAFKSLSENGWTRGEIGRGTFVSDRGTYEPAASFSAPVARVSSRSRNPWRKRALVSLMERLRSSFPKATNCSFGGPGASLLPLKFIKRHWLAAFDDVSNSDLQYKTVDPIGRLSEVLRPRLVADNIPATNSDLLVGTSAQQFVNLASNVIGRLVGVREPIVAVEQPGYYTIFDAWDHTGVRMIGVETDGNGAVPESLESAIRNGANAVLLTPRAHNPTGASWTAERLQALGDVLSRYPHVLAIEDDHFADLAQDRAGSLLADSRMEDRVVYIRSFSKSIAPDLRLSVAVARPRLKTLLQEAKTHADGWSSRLLQRVLAGVLEDDGLASWLDRVRSTYRTRRERVADVLRKCGIPGVEVCPALDGVNLWIHLPSGLDAGEVIERGAALGVLAAPGEVFYLSPGHSDVVRFNVGSVETERVSVCAELLGKAIAQSGGSRSTAIYV
ncbi:MAG: PLP-dependent aminotransferase family protein [Acidobacteriaceae bacterium]|nr:PLP-dependent aminotransferase family protein [Acidobacteriaceae bacterium]